MIDDASTTDTLLGVRAICPCHLHRLPSHPRNYPSIGTCRCECDHVADEKRWAA